MIVLILLAFVGMLTGIFLILGMTPFTFAEELTKPLSGRRQPISKRIQQVNHPKEPKGIRKTVLEAREMLILTGKGGKFAAICAFSLFLAAMGAVICIVIQNYFSRLWCRSSPDRRRKLTILTRIYLEFCSVR